MVTQMFIILIIVVSAAFLELGDVLAQQRFDNATDQQSLLVFKSHITNDPYSVLQTWNSNTPFCNWTGVICNMTKQRVTSLNLANLALSGTMSPHIANLSFLSVLNLQNNTFYGILPTELGRLFRLQFLILSSNLIQGTIPPSLGECTRLVSLDLMTNRFEGTIPSELGSLSKLQVLRLTTNFLTGQIPASLHNLSSITNLLLSENYFIGSIPEELGHLPKLINLQIDQNNITGEIPSSLLNSSSLIMLSLTLNKLTGSLPSDMFSRLSNLTTLFLGGNNLTGTIPPSIANASILERIDLSVNNFIGQLPLMGNMPGIQVMNLGDNQLTSEGEAGMGFIASLASSIRLQVFSLVSNRLTGELPSSIGNLSRVLSQLVIGNNHLEGNLPTELGNLQGLTMLSLEYNSFSGNIPPSLGKLSVLQNLYLNQNNLSGNIPQSLGNLSQLYEMSLSHNKLSGTIPESLGNFQHLQVLDLSVNNLYGSIPKAIYELPSLNLILNLSSNLLTGSVLVDVGKLKMIQGIDLSKNKLSGDIPASIGGCSSLLVLDLSGNSFQGSIPKSLAELKGIEYIDLSRNNLSGRIPSSLQSLKFLQQLNLSGNQLEGEVPIEGIFTNTTVVSLGGNAGLCGGKPVLGLPNCIVPKKHSGGSKPKIIVGLAVGFSGFGIFSILCVFFFRKRNAKSMENDDVISFDGPHRFYTYYDLRNATHNFNLENLIGEGSFGSVYKGILHDGTLAAIKVFNINQKGALKSFISECEALRNVRHRNLIQIMSACSSRDFKALVLQFMTNGNLEHWLYKRSWLELDMRRRLEIAIDVAFAVEYLHHDCETPVLHCDLKPSNVLLDENMTAHVADFGLARMILKNAKEGSISTLGLKGSIGYVPPEYGVSGLVSLKGDVYSYGILILEIFTGRKPTDELFTGELNIQKWVFMALPNNTVDLVNHEFVVKDELLEVCLVSVLKIGLSCAETSPEDRPTMREVSGLLRSVKNQLSVL